MSLNFRPAAILFDMDGTMLDSESAVTECWLQSAQEHGYHFDEAVQHAMIGLADPYCRAMLQQHFGPELPIASLFARTDALYSVRVNAGLPTKPGLHALLDWLDAAGLPKAVGTSSTRARTMAALGATGLLPRFQAVVCADDVAHAKPAPDIYLQAAAQLGVAPQACLVLEDSDPGVRAAHAAGMQVIQVPDIKQPDAELLALGHKVKPDLGEVLGMLQRAFR